MAVYVYNLDNPEVNNPYSTEDYGLISSASTSSEDIGAVSDGSPTFNFLEDDWYSISVSESLIPYGTIGILNTSQLSASYNYISSGIMFEFTTQTLTENVVFTWVGNGTVFEIGNGLERTVNAYLSSGTLRLDTAVAETALESITISPVGDTTLYTITGNYTGLQFIAQIAENTQLFSISGVVVEKNTESYVGVGTLTFSETAVEKNTESYVGLGNLTLSGTALEAYSAQTPEDFVLYTFSGTALEAYSANPPENTQLFSISGVAVEKNTESYSGSGNILLSGSAEESFTPTNYAGSGTLFSLDTAEESITYDYNESSIETGNIVDYGNIVDVSSGIPLDYGQVSSTPSPQIGDYAFIVDQVIPVVYPFGGMSLSGSAICSANYRLYIDGIAIVRASYSEVVSGSIVLSTSALESETESYIGLGTITFSGTALEVYSANPPENTQLFTISGGYTDLAFIAQTPEDTQLFSISGTSIEKDVDSYVGVGTLTFSGVAVEKDVDSYVGLGTLTFSGVAVEKNTESYVGLGTLTFSGSALEAYSAQTPEDFVLYTFSGVAVEKNTESYVGLGTLTFSGTAVEKNTESYVGLGTLTFSGTAVEKNTESYVGLGNLTFSGSALEAYSAQTPEDFVLYTFSGTALEAYSAQTPEDFVLYTFSGVAVEKNTESYVGLGTLTFSEVAIEKDVDSYVGLGTLTFSGTALEAYSAQTPEDFVLYTFSGTALEAYSAQTPENTPTLVFSGELLHPKIDYTPHYGIEKNIGIGTTGIKFGIGVGTAPDSEGNLRDAKTYSNRYPINDKVPGTGIGTFKFDQTNNIARYSPLTPYSATGLFNVITGFSPEDTITYPGGPGVGKSWSFARSSYITSGIVTIPGSALTRPVRTFTYSGSGNATISQQTTPTLERQTDNYKGSGSITLSAGADKIIRKILINGKGTLFVISGISETLESISAQIPDNTVLYQFTSSASESLSSIPPTDQPILSINGAASDESITISEVGTGVIPVDVFGTAAVSAYTPSISNTVLFKFTQHTSDVLYDSCDSEEFTCDYQDAANVVFVANPVEDTILFTLSGIASTKEITTYSYIGVGVESIFGSYQSVKFVSSEIGFGTIFIATSSGEKEGDTYNGSGSLFALSGKSESYSAQTPESTILISINGSATTKVESEYSVVGIGIFNISGTSSTKKVSTYTQIGSGIATLSGELLYPNIIFIPAYKSSGSISILGSSNNFVVKIYKDTSGSLFGFSSGFESFTKSTYVGLGTIYIQETSGTTINNPFQIPRTYVVII